MNGIYTTQNFPQKTKYKIPCCFEIQANHLKAARQPDLVVVNSIKKKERKKREHIQ